MQPTTISLARLLELDVPRPWQEAVAVTMCAGDAMKRSGTALTADLCVIATTGELAYTGKGSPYAGSGDALASLLAALLERQAAPPELRALAVPAGETSGADRLDVLMTALAYYERPNRQADVAALAERALAAEAQEAELQRLRSAPRATTMPRPAAIGRTFERILMIAGGAAVVGALLVTVTAWYLARPSVPAPIVAITPPETAPTETPSAARSTVSSIVAKASEAAAGVTAAGLRAIGLVPAGPDSEAAPPGRPPAPPAAARARRAPDPPAGTAVPSAPIATVEPGAAAVAPAAPVAELPVVAADPEDAVSAPPPSGAFTAADTGVEPPVLVYPQVPTDPGATPPAPDEPHFDLLVNERGEVEQVRLRAAEARLEDRMMVSAVKAWRFKPAVKDGQPVRYRVRIPISK